MIIEKHILVSGEGGRAGRGNVGNVGSMGSVGRFDEAGILCEAETEHIDE